MIKLGLFILLFSMSVSFVSAAELCYVGNGGHIYLHSVGSDGDIPAGLQKEFGKLSGLLGRKSTADKRVTPESLTGGICRMPQWLDKDTIIFVYDLKPDSIPPKTKVDILSLKTGSIEWITALAGSVSIGFDKASGTVDFMKTLKKNPDSEAGEVYLGQYGLSTRKAKSALAFRSYGYMAPKPIYRWPDQTMRLVPVATSDVSDQVGVYSTVKKKLVPVKWLGDKWKRDNMGGWATTAMAPGSGCLAMSVLGGQGELQCTLGRIDTASGAVTKMQSTRAIARGPVFSLDGSRIAWWEENLTEATKTVWLSPVSDPSPRKIAGGWDPAWRP